MPGYEKTKRYFTRNNLYQFFEKNGDIKRAMKNAEILSQIQKKTPEEEVCYSEIYKVIQLLNELNE